ncbi:formyltransferase family protein [Pseudomonas sp. CCNWLW56]|uniref:formyltransferase family protein n=1 Tax=unclassified Pseudomonas TaxID=196821 RepID=UPI0030785271
MLERWMSFHRAQHDIVLVRSKTELTAGDLLFLISCGEIIDAKDRKKFSKTLVIHASDLPKGRGWSPHVWSIIEGASEITVTLLEAEDRVDSGAVWKKIKIEVPKHFLFYEINEVIFSAEYELMNFAVENFFHISPVAQSEVASSYYPKRMPKDSELDPEKSIKSQFDLIRVSDPDRYPAFFKMHGHTYKMMIEKI